MKIGTISLGCDKNRVDTEKMLFRLLEQGHTFVSEENEAEVIIINTCAFIESAKNEAIDEILSAVEYKKKNKAKIVVTGCLSQRYQEELVKAIPEIDLCLGIGDYDLLCDYLDKNKIDEGLIYQNEDKFIKDRVLTTPYHYAYLKIADGCNNHCTYCVIPNIRGEYRSEKLEDLFDEAKILCDDGVRELILVAQDVSRYGIDLYGEKSLIKLLDKLSTLNFDIIRLLYLEPEMVDDELIDYIAKNDKIAKYMDIPFQHISDRILKLMNRHTTENDIKELVKKVKDRGIKIRSSFIVGFPSESEEDFLLLCDFIKNYKIDYAGFFEYSLEEGTLAEKLPYRIDDDIKKKRCEKLRAIQEEVIRANNRSYIGKVLKVLYEEIDVERGQFIGRTSFQAPDIDTLVRFVSDKPVSVGEFYNVEILDVDSFDLYGRVK